MLTDNYSVNELWTEKYRPTKLNQLVLNESDKERFEFYIQNPDKMNHQIFIGPPGCGKTTLARILIDNIIEAKQDVIILNGSEQKGIQVIRDIILEFVKTPSFISPIKIVFIDESDNLTPDAWKSLRFILETYSENARFIMTGNHDVYPDYIKSRCTITRFKPVSKEYVFQFTKTVLEQENISFTDKDLETVINLFYPDLRKIISVLQQISIINKHLDLNKLDTAISNDDKLVFMTLDLIKAILTKDPVAKQIILEISTFITKRYIDYYHVYRSLFEKISPLALPIKVVISKYANRLSYVLEPAMSYFEFIYELKETCEKYVSILDPNSIIIGE